MAKLQAMASCQLNHLPRKPDPLLPVLRETTPIVPSCQHTIGCGTEFPQHCLTVLVTATLSSSTGAALQFLSGSNGPTAPGRAQCCSLQGLKTTREAPFGNEVAEQQWRTGCLGSVFPCGVAILSLTDAPLVPLPQCFQGS